MTSLKIHGSRSRFSNFLAITTVPLILIGFIATSGTAMWAFTQSAPANLQSVEAQTQVSTTLVCLPKPSNDETGWAHNFGRALMNAVGLDMKVFAQPPGQIDVGDILSVVIGD